MIRLPEHIHVHALAPSLSSQTNSNAVVAYRWLLERWLVRACWLSLLLGVLLASFLPASRRPVTILLLLVLVSGNTAIWLLLHGDPNQIRLKWARQLATGVDCLLSFAALGLSAGTRFHDLFPAVLLLLLLAIGLRWGSGAFLGAACGMALILAGLMLGHVLLFGAFDARTAAGLLAGWELLVALTTLFGLTLLRARQEWYAWEVERANQQSASMHRLECGLSAREWTLLPLLAQEGLTYAAIGEQLHISPETVKTHVHHLGAKLGVSGRRQVVAVAHERGLLRPQSTPTRNVSHTTQGSPPRQV